ncbi:MAG: LysM peptidoglycan-binding domain-containing protein [Bacteroidales bacterium]|nr:LysM peptidoglycan-binding domain-containing protein [Bacteroidales bacterium]
MKYSLLSILLLFFVAFGNAQKNTSEKSGVKEDYYFQFWSTNQDSLKNNWVIKQHLSDGNTKASAENENYLGLTADKYLVYYNKLESKISLQNSIWVEEILNSYLKSNNVGIALAYNDYLSPIFEEALQEEGIPLVLKNLPLALSCLNINATNKLGAGGIWQLMYANARRQGLRVDSYVDERRDVSQASKAAAKELKSYYDLYKNWDLAIAAFACGPTNVNKAIRRNNNQLIFDSIYNSLPDYGRDIVPAFTAASMLIQFSKELHIVKPQWKFTIEIDTIAVSQRLHFVQIQDLLDIPIEELRYLNPKYKFDIVPAVNEIFHIYLPVGSLAKFNELEDSIYHYKDTILFDLKKPVVLPPAAKGRHYARYEPELPPDNSKLMHYTIKSGDNLGYIASWYGVKVRQIEDWNNIYDPRRLKLGKKLKIYVPENKASYYSGIDAMSFEQKQKRVGKSVSSSQTASRAPKKEEPLGKDFFWYTVRSGESPYTIAKKYPGVSSDDILRWNKIENARNIKVGQKLKIKKVK